MDGIHDMGGRQGFGAVRYAPGASAFHAAWEVRANSLYAFAVRRGLFNMDEYRHAIERMEPRHYLSASYYERSLTSLATLLVEKGIVSREELERRAGGRFPSRLPDCLRPHQCAGREAFKPGDRVRVRQDHVPGHVRMPGYIRGKCGVVVGESPVYPFPTPRRTASIRRTSRRTTSDSAAKTSGRTRPMRRSSTSGCSRAIWSASGRHSATRPVNPR
jgi:nitrile hydratase